MMGLQIHEYKFLWLRVNKVISGTILSVVKWSDTNLQETYVTV